MCTGRCDKQHAHLPKTVRRPQLKSERQQSKRRALFSPNTAACARRPIWVCIAGEFHHPPYSMYMHACLHVVPCRRVLLVVVPLCGSCPQLCLALSFLHMAAAASAAKESSGKDTIELMMLPMDWIAKVNHGGNNTGALPTLHGQHRGDCSPITWILVGTAHGSYLTVLPVKTTCARNPHLSCHYCCTPLFPRTLGQMVIFDGATGQPTSERRATSAGVAEPPIASPGTEEMLHLTDMEGGVSDECRLRRGLRKLGKLRQPQNVLEFLAVAKRRGDPLSLRVFK